MLGKMLDRAPVSIYIYKLYFLFDLIVKLFIVYLSNRLNDALDNRFAIN